MHNWSKEWKINLNVQKSEISVFSTWTNDSKRIPTIDLQGKRIPFNSTPRLLGVILDQSLTFIPHINKLISDTNTQLRAMKIVSYSTWGWRKSILKTMYNFYIKRQDGLRSTSMATMVIRNQHEQIGNSPESSILHHH